MMEFDLNKFNTTNFKDRVEAVPVPRLKQFFKSDKKKKSKPEWHVRGLTGLESALAKKAVSANSNIDAVIKSIGSTLKDDVVEGVKELLGVSGDKVPDELVQRYSWLVSGSVNPVCDHQTAMRVAVNFPEDFYLLTNKIMQLTGMGRLGE